MIDRKEELMKLEILKKYAYNLSSESYSPSVRTEALKAYSMLLSNQIELEKVQENS